MLEFALSITLIVSLAGLIVIVRQKLSYLLKMPEPASVGFDWRSMLSKAKGSTPLNRVSFEAFLQKALSKIRILVLRIDVKISSWLQKLREKKQKSKFGENDNYWQEVRKFTKKK